MFFGSSQSFLFCCLPSISYVRILIALNFFIQFWNALYYKYFEYIQTKYPLVTCHLLTERVYSYIYIAKRLYH